ncbi:MAG: penicillin-binding protein A [Oscillibacter sp.]|jgi:penicillin-binding protein 2|nr:penicillin-binding protein A [Oscillibacter sp.]
MDEREPKRISRRRLRLLGGFLLAVLLCYTGLLYNTQVVHGKEYLEQSVRTITTQQTVEASRGVITDRSGTVLVSNRQTYNLTFDPSLLGKEDDENEAIARIIRLCRQQNLPWQDNLPVGSAAPWSYTYDQTSTTQKRRFVTFLQKRMKLVAADASYRDVDESTLIAAGLTADVLMADMRKEFSIPADWPDADARAVLGILYELSVRELINTTPYVIVEDVSSSLISLVNDGRYQGVKVTSSSAREYNTSCAAHILGTVGNIFEVEADEYRKKGYSLNELVGKTGVEKAFEEYLRGTDGKRVVSTNAEGKVTSELYSVEPKPGDTVAITIDLRLQKAVEDALGATVSRMTAKDGIIRGAGAAVIQVGTGDILSLASYPTYDPALYKSNYAALSTDPAKPFLNRATQGTYAPGSTFKPCTAVAGLEEGVISTSTTIRDTGYWVYPTSKKDGQRWGFYCWNHSGHGSLNVTQAITNSCNYFFGEVGYRLGLDKLNEYAAAFGLGKHTGIEIGDRAGTLATQDAGQDLAPWAAFGQASYTATPLQLANYIATLVSGGKHYDAHLLKTVKNADNTQVVYAESPKPSNNLNIKESTLSAVKQGMHNLTTTGALTSYFRSCVVEAGAKTGTAQVSSQKVNNGVFVCFAPYDDPQIALAIAIEKGGTGASLASTAVDILNAYFTADQVGTAVITGENQLLQ